RTAERVEYGVANARASHDARLDQILGECGEMGLGVGLGCDGPDAALVATGRVWVSYVCFTFSSIIITTGLLGCWCCPIQRILVSVYTFRIVRFPDRVRVIKISLLFRQKKNEFMALCRTIRAALRHRIWLVPDDIAAQIPAIGLQRDSQACWHHAKV